MDLLTERPASRRRGTAAIALAAAFAVAVVAASCLNLTGSRPPTFPHAVHVEGMKLDCTFCHGGVYTSDQPGMPPPELCAPCHDQMEAGLPPERRIASFYDESGRFLRAAPQDLAADVRFSHADHANHGELECASCHAETITEEFVRQEAIDWKTRCMTCHEARGYDSDNCSTCHQQIDRDYRPRSHAAAWDVYHGEVVRSGDTASQHRCELCHNETVSCQACHQNNPPKDHNNYFRLRGHGVQASLDRTRCYTCHRTDTCVQCHSETRPLSHRGGFGDPQQRHCNGCHFPLGDTGCAVCHRGTPSHMQAAPLPPNHNPAMNCRLCHGAGQALPHPDGGHACTICHK